LEGIKAVSKPRRDKMPPSERAKQFMPFAAVKGLDEALEKKRREMLLVERAVLSPEMEEALNAQISALKKGMEIAISHYRCGEYLLFRGVVEKVDPVEKYILVSGESIAFEDIRAIRMT